MNSRPIETDSKMQKWMHRYYYGVVVCCVLGVPIVSWFLFFNNAVDTLLHTRAVYTTQAGRIVEQTTQLESLQQLQKEIDEVEHDRLQQLNAIIPTGFNADAVMEQFRAFAESANIQIDKMDITHQSATDTELRIVFTNPNIQVAIITVDFRMDDPSYAGMKEVLDTLEHFTPALDLFSIDFHPQLDLYTLQFYTYYTAVLE